MLPRTVLRTIAATGLLLGLAACGQTADEPSVATAESRRPAAGATAAPSSDAVTAYVDGQRAWVRCMREHGIQAPDPDARGEVDLGPLFRSGGVTKSDPRFRAAIEACASRQPTQPPELRPTEPPVTPERLANLRAYAKCLRENGMPDHPDPLPNGEWPEPDASERPETPAEAEARDRAFQICDPVVSGSPKASYDPNKRSQG